MCHSRRAGVRIPFFGNGCTRKWHMELPGGQISLTGVVPWSRFRVLPGELLFAPAVSRCTRVSIVPLARRIYTVTRLRACDACYLTLVTLTTSPVRVIAPSNPKRSNRKTIRFSSGTDDASIARLHALARYFAVENFPLAKGWRCA